MPLTRSLGCKWISKSPLRTNVFDTVNPTLPHTLDIDDSGGNNSCSLSDVAECSTILDKDTPPTPWKFYLMERPITRQETLGYLGSCIHHSLWMNTNNPLAYRFPNSILFFYSVLQLILSIFGIIVTPFYSSTEGSPLKCLFQSADNARNSKDVNALKFQLVHHDTFYNGQKLSWKNILSAMYVDWGPPHLSIVVCYIFHLLIPLPCNFWFYKDCNRNCKNPVLYVIRTLGTPIQAIYYNLQNICFSSLLDLKTITIMSPKIDAPYLWIRRLGLFPFNLAYGLL